MPILIPCSTPPLPGKVQDTASVSYFSAAPRLGSDYYYRQADIAHTTTAAIEKFFHCPGIIPDYDSPPSASSQYCGSQPASVFPSGYWKPQLPRISEEYIHPSQLPQILGGCVHPLPTLPPHLQIPGRQPQGNPSPDMEHLNPVPPHPRIPSKQSQGKNPSSSFRKPDVPPSLPHNSLISGSSGSSGSQLADDREEKLDSAIVKRKTYKTYKYLNPVEKARLIELIKAQPAKTEKGANIKLARIFDVSVSFVSNLRSVHGKGKGQKQKRQLWFHKSEAEKQKIKAAVKNHIESQNTNETLTDLARRWGVAQSLMSYYKKQMETTKRK